MSEENHVSHFHYLQSADRLTGQSAGNFTAKAHNFDKTYAFNISSVQIPYFWYAFTSNTNTILSTVDGLATVYTATLPVGNYNIVNILPAIKSAMDANGSGKVYTVTQSDVTSKITITQNVGTLQILGAGSANKLLGFGATDSTYAISQTGPNIFNLSGTKYIDIFSTKLTSHGSKVSDSTGGGGDRIVRIPVGNYKFGDTIHYIPYFTTYNHDGRNLQNVDLQLKDEYGNIVDLNGYDWWIKLKFSSRYTHFNEDVNTLASKN